MRIKRLYVPAALVLLFLVFATPAGAKAALKPSVREEKAVLYTDSEPYEFHFINLDPGAKMTFSSSNEAVIRINKQKAVPVKNGKATVTVKLTQNEKAYTFKVKFTVKKVPKEKSAKDYKKLAKKTVKRLESEMLDKSGTILNYGDGKYCTTQEELDEYMYRNTGKYAAFSVVFSDVGLFRSEEEYLAMFPYLTEITIKNPTNYRNAKSVIISVSKNTGAYSSEEIAVDYALSGGNTSYLSKSEKKLYNKVVKVAEKLRKDNVYETVKAIHDYIIKKCEYEFDESNGDRYSLKSAVEDGKTVCSGYTKYFCSLCKALGINAKFVIGSASGEPGDHGWNLVEIGHKWYGVDVTWDDGGKNKNGKNVINYKYFLVADEEMKKDHTWDENLYPKAVSKDLGIIYSNLEKYPVVSGKKEALAYVKEVAKKLASSKSNTVSLEFREITASSSAFTAINKELNSYSRSLGVHWKDWDTDTSGPGWVYIITLYKK